MAKNQFLPIDAPKFAAMAGPDFHWYGGVPAGELSAPFKHECLHGYLAAISYVDALVGRLLRTLDETGLAKNTVVVFWSDHGYYMGEHTRWGTKSNNYEGATRNCFIVSYPGMKALGQKTNAIVQAVDIAPTLTELCGLPAVPVFEGAASNLCLITPQPSKMTPPLAGPKQGWLGIGMRVGRWRFVEWTKPREQPVHELFDMVADPQDDVNVAARPENAQRIKTFSEQLRQRFPVQAFVPPPSKPDY